MDNPPLAFRRDTFQTENEWLDARRQGIGASDSPVILGLRKYSPLALYHEKRGVNLDETNARARRSLRMGQLMEPVISGLFREEAPDVALASIAPLDRGQGYYHMERSHTLPWLTCTVDRWTVHQQPVELKNVSVWAAQDWLDLGEVPLDFQVQVQHQMAVTGADSGYIAALIGGVDFKWAPIKRDQEFIDVMLPVLQQFAERIVEGNPPPVDGLEETKDVLTALRKRADIKEAVVEMPPEWADVRDEHERLADEIKALNTKKDEIENRVRQFLLDHAAQIGALRDGRTYSWKTQSRAGYVVEATSFPVLRRLGKKQVP